MLAEFPLPRLAADVVDVVKTVMSEIRPKLTHAALSGDRGETGNLRHTDNFLSVHDMWMHQRYRDLFQSRLRSFVYASEEADPQVVGDDDEPDLCVLVDPLDTSELAVRGLHGYTHVMIYSRALARPVAAVVGDIFHHVQIYVGARDHDGRDRAYVITTDSPPYVLAHRPPPALADSLITNYLMRPAERFVPLARQDRLIDALAGSSGQAKNRGRIGVDFGSVGLCHVAAGLTEAMIEFAKGFAVWDLAPGHYILHAAGGAVLDLSGTPIPLNYEFGSLSEIGLAMSRRQSFVAARNTNLALEILRVLDV